MAVAAYYRWDHEGRPLEPAQPIREIVERMKVAFPKAAGSFSWHADEAHYTAVPAEDHTPYSQTGWPWESPEWWVFATDIMHRPDLGVDCHVLFAYWLAEAKAGRMPWLKYMIWQAKLYDVRNQWRPQANSGHFDHIHLSARTDWQHKGLGAWSIVPRSREVTMLLGKIKGKPECFVGDGLEYRQVVNGPTLDRLRAAGVPMVEVANQDELTDLLGQPWSPGGGGGLTFDQTVEACRQGSEKASDS